MVLKNLQKKFMQLIALSLLIILSSACLAPIHAESVDGLEMYIFYTSGNPEFTFTEKKLKIKQTFDMQEGTYSEGPWQSMTLTRNGKTKLSKKLAKDCKFYSIHVGDNMYEPSNGHDYYTFDEFKDLLQSSIDDCNAGIQYCELSVAVVLENNKIIRMFTISP